MSLFYKEVSKRVREEKPEFSAGAKLVDNFVDSLEKQGLLPKKLPEQVRPKLAEKPQETTVAEQLILRERFTEEEKEALRNNGAVIYTLGGETILSQKEAQRAKRKPSFVYVVNAGERLLAVPAKQCQVAIFPAPEEFFVPCSFSKDTQTQERLAAEDAKRLGLESVTQIIPDEAATLTEITFQHQDATGVWLFGKEYAAAQGLDWVHGRTKNPTNSSGSGVAGVGDADPDDGLIVGGWIRGDGHLLVGAVRLVVPKF